MSKDYAILKRISFPSMTDAERKSYGRTSYAFSAFENDVLFTPGRQLVTTDGTNKLVQGILKILLTPKGTCLEDPNYGADLEGNIGGKMQQESYANLRDEVLAALNYYAMLTADSENPDESLLRVEEVKAVRDEEDPRVILVYLSVTTRSGKLVNVVVPQVE